MAKGPYYTTEENEHLLSLWEDLKELKLSYKEVAEKAQRYGICRNRNTDALAQHIRFLVSEQSQIELEEQTCEEVQEEIDIEKAYLKRENANLKKLLDGVVGAVIGKATLFHGPYFDSLKYDYPAITRWFIENMPDEYDARIEELRLNDNTNA